MKDRLFVPGKLEYARGNRPEVACILCSVAEGSEAVTRLEVHRTPGWVVSLNLYPYNAGHLFIFPLRHLEHLRDLTAEEAGEVHGLQLRCMEVLDELYQPHGYNIGMNHGPAGGASIEHLHIHVVPRYRRELGFMDLVGGARIVVEDPIQTLEKVRAAFGRRNTREERL